VAGVTDWVAWAIVVMTSEPGIVSDTHAYFHIVELGVVCAVVTITVIWSMTMVELISAAVHTVRVTLALVDAAVLFTPVVIAYTVAVFLVSVLNAFLTIACGGSEAA